MPQPPAVEALTVPLRDGMTDVWRRVEDLEVELFASLPTLPAAQRRAVLRTFEAAVLDLVDEALELARTYARTGVLRAYEYGAVAVVSEGFTWTPPHRRAAGQLAAETFDDLLKATRYVRRDTKRLIREIAAAKTRQVIVDRVTAVQGGRNTAAALAQHGIAAVRYRNGARVGLDTYTEMVARTKSGTAYNAGTLNGSRDQGIEWLEIFDGPSCGFIGHSDTDLANGTVRHIDECASAILSHVRCQRAFGPRPDIMSREAAAEASISQTREQMLDARQAELARLEAQRRRRQRRHGR